MLYYGDNVLSDKSEVKLYTTSTYIFEYADRVSETFYTIIITSEHLSKYLGQFVHKVIYNEQRYFRIDENIGYLYSKDD